MDVNADIKLHYNQHRILFQEIPKLYQKGTRQFIFPKGRRWGFTQGTMKLAVQLMLSGLSPGLWVDTVNTNINRYMDIFMIPAVKEVGLPNSYFNYNRQEKLFTIGKYRMDLRSADRPQNIEGFSYKFVILNEAGIILRRRYLWENAISPMMIDHNPFTIVGGTPKGRGIFETLAAMGQDPLNNQYAHFHQTTYDNFLLSRQNIDEKAGGMPQAVKDQEIFAKFLAETASVFKNITAAKGAKPEEPQPGKRYFMGVDLAKHVDFTVIIILDQMGNMVYFNRTNQVSYNFQEELILRIAKQYQAKVCLDASHGSVGDPIFDSLRQKYPNMEGFNFTNQSKQALIESLMLAFEAESIKIFDDVLIDELELFAYEFTKSGAIIYSAPEGYHDDCVIALALANWLLRQGRNVDYGRYD